MMPATLSLFLRLEIDHDKGKKINLVILPPPA